MSEASTEDAQQAVDAPADEQGAAATEAAGIEVVCAGSTAVGQVREHNEDNFVIADLTQGKILPRDTVCEQPVGEGGFLFAVCDGMGGAAAGEVASQMAVDILVEAMRRGGPPGHRDALARRLVSTVEESGRRIYEAAQKERSRRGMGTTATVAVLLDKVLFLAEVGDSRAYLLRNDTLRQVTKDQSLVNQLIEAGHLTEDEAEAFEHSNIILQALGTSETVQVDLTFVELRKGDRLMMCSDGLSGLVHADTLRSTLGVVEDAAECCAKLIEYAEGGGGHDNITVVVADFDGDGLAEAQPDDTFGYMQYPLPEEDDASDGAGDESAETDDDDKPMREATADEIETLAPPAHSPDDSRSNALWIGAGVVSMIIAVAFWLNVDPANTEPHAADKPGAEALPSDEPKPEPEAIAEVKVNIHTDVEGATLIVNGESKGAISSDKSLSLSLIPGAYRFEAQQDGDSKAVTVATVRGDTPMDVYLKQPGVPEGRAGAGGSRDGEQGATPEASTVVQGDGAKDKPTPSIEAPQEAQAAPQDAQAAADKPRKKPRSKPRKPPKPAAEATAAASDEATAARAPEPKPPEPAPPQDIPENPF